MSEPCPICGTEIEIVSSPEGTSYAHPSRRSEYELRQRRRAQDEEDRAYRLGAVARDAISLAEHLAGYVLVDAERERFMTEITGLRDAVNAEMNRASSP